MKFGLVSGDGLPISGLLTIFRNVLDIGITDGLVELPVPADLGYSWRPDKGDFYPRGAIVDGYPSWLHVLDSSSVVTAVHGDLPERWQDLRRQVARATDLTAGERADLRSRIAAMTTGYRDYFLRWLAEYDVDWVVAVNMTLSDAVPVTAGLHAAVRARYGSGGRPGGVLFWDHDLFGSCAIVEDGQRVYPAAPNEFTPLPTAEDHVRWVVISEELAAEAREYPTDAVPRVLPNVLPTVPTGHLEERHHAFLRQHGLAPDRPLVLVPVRMFRIKGVEIAVEVFAAARAACVRSGLPAPYLLVFGSLEEDADYAAEVLALIRELRVEEDVVLLGGVPLGSYQDGGGRWRLDEVDLLRVAASRDGLVLFTPNVTDVETIGLGPALASAAGLPSAVTPYDAFDQVYGSDFRCLRLGATAGSRSGAGSEVARALHDPASRLGAGGGATNRAALDRIFPTEPWRRMLHDLQAHLSGEADTRSLPATPAPSFSQT
ncbi:glycosyltransferase family protein [Micromonospora schwarzwaldensis]|uniref:hypothetical protein n=1 Tax=Micromonospora sp. DSM 45708 TaxID=3111767 RepID=UPI0031E23215